MRSVTSIRELAHPVGAGLLVVAALAPVPTIWLRGLEGPRASLAVATALAVVASLGALALLRRARSPRWTLVWPTSLLMVLTVAALLQPDSGPLLPGLTALAFMYLGLTQRPGSSLGLAALLVPTMLVMLRPLSTPETLIRTAVQTVVMVLVAELAARLTQRLEHQHRELLREHDDLVRARAALDASARELRRVGARLAASASIARAAQSGADPRPLVIEGARGVAEASTVALVEVDGASYRVTATSERSLHDVQFPCSLPTLTRDVFERAERTYVRDVTLDDRVAPSLRVLVHTRAMLWEPVLVDDVVVAVLIIGWPEARPEPLPAQREAVDHLVAETQAAFRAEAQRGHLERHASSDPLTGLANRRAWDSRVQALLAEATTRDEPVTVAIVDLDHFKDYNDDRGHLAGDALLRELAMNLGGVLRREDLAARWGGEEFALALPGCDGEAARSVLLRVLGIVPEGQTCSAGSAVWRPGDDLDVVLRAADAALYQAKAAGRARLVEGAA